MTSWGCQVSDSFVSPIWTTICEPSSGKPNRMIRYATGIRCVRSWEYDVYGVGVMS